MNKRIKKFFKWLRSFKFRRRKESDSCVVSPAVTSENEVAQVTPEQQFIMEFAKNDSPTVDDYIKLYKILLSNQSLDKIITVVIFEKYSKLVQLRDEEVVFLDYLMQFNPDNDLFKAFSSRIPMTYYAIDFKWCHPNEPYTRRIKMKRGDFDVLELDDEPYAYDAYIKQIKRFENGEGAFKCNKGGEDKSLQPYSE